MFLIYNKRFLSHFRHLVFYKLFLNTIIIDPLTCLFLFRLFCRISLKKSIFHVLVFIVSLIFFSVGTDNLTIFFQRVPITGTACLYLW